MTRSRRRRFVPTLFGVAFNALATRAYLPPYPFRQGLNGARDRLKAEGHEAEILWTHGAEAIQAEARAALGRRDWDVVVIGAGLRTLPPMAEAFERLINLIHAEAPGARLAFSSNPADSDAAARRQLSG